MVHKTVYLCLLSPLTFLCVSSFRLLCRSGCSALDFLVIALLGLLFIIHLFVVREEADTDGGCTDTDQNRHYHDPYPLCDR